MDIHPHKHGGGPLRFKKQGRTHSPPPGIKATNPHSRSRNSSHDADTAPLTMSIAALAEPYFILV
eukprot:366260-Chlamydomonas_euryale.AAC.7